MTDPLTLAEDLSVEIEQIARLCPSDESREEQIISQHGALIAAALRLYVAVENAETEGSIVILSESVDERLDECRRSARGAK